MRNSERNELRRAAQVAFKARDFEKAFRISLQLANNGAPSALFTCGLILEKGWLNGEKDLDRANEFYTRLAVNFNSDEGYLGCARIILIRKDSTEREKALKYCLTSIEGQRKQQAFILLGRVYEELTAPPDWRSAKKAYFRASLLGSTWGMRKYAHALVRSGNYIGGALMHVVATLVSPVIVLFGGMKMTRRG